MPIEFTSITIILQHSYIFLCFPSFYLDFAELFPDINIMHGSFTVITISQKTINDMTGWSSDVEVEREDLLEHVRTTACSSIFSHQGPLTLNILT